MKRTCSYCFQEAYNLMTDNEVLTYDSRSLDQSLVVKCWYGVWTMILEVLDIFTMRLTIASSQANTSVFTMSTSDHLLSNYITDNSDESLTLPLRELCPRMSPRNGVGG